MVPLDRHFVVYPGGAGVKRVPVQMRETSFTPTSSTPATLPLADVDQCRKRPLLHRQPLLHLTKKGGPCRRGPQQKTTSTQAASYGSWQRPGEVDFSWPDSQSRATIIPSQNKETSFQTFACKLRIETPGLTRRQKQNIVHEIFLKQQPCHFPVMVIFFV